MLTPNLLFGGNCREALDYYASVFGAEVENCMPYGDYVPEGADPVPEGLREWVMHAEMTICGSRFWFSDEVAPLVQGTNVVLALTVDTAREAQHIFDGLAEGGVITLPPTPTFYSKFHGGVTDRFDIRWNVVALEPNDSN